MEIAELRQGIRWQQYNFCYLSVEKMTPQKIDEQK